jgi:hypothetical protein
MSSRRGVESITRAGEPQTPNRIHRIEEDGGLPDLPVRSARACPPAQPDALASQQCAARVADALRRLGYGFAVIPSTAKPKRG